MRETRRHAGRLRRGDAVVSSSRRDGGIAPGGHGQLDIETGVPIAAEINRDSFEGPDEPKQYSTVLPIAATVSSPHFLAFCGTACHGLIEGVN